MGVASGAVRILGALRLTGGEKLRTVKVTTRKRTGGRAPISANHLEGSVAGVMRNSSTCVKAGIRCTVCIRRNIENHTNTRVLQGTTTGCSSRCGGVVGSSIRGTWGGVGGYAWVARMGGLILFFTWISGGLWGRLSGRVLLVCYTVAGV